MTIRNRLSAVIHASPHAPAVDIPSTGEHFTYGELANEAAAWQRRLGARSGTVVIHVDKGASYYALMACAFLYGRSICPIDRVNPLARLRQVVGQFERPCVVTDSVEVADALRAESIDVIVVAETAVDAGEPTSSPEARYYISTSGTTGTPKLVEVRHDATEAFIDWSIPFYGIDANTRWGQFSSIGFDLSIVDFVSVMCGGGTLVAVCTLAEKMRLDRFVAANRITHWHSVPTVVPYLLRSGGANLATLKLITFCGEPLLRSQCEALRVAQPSVRLINTYGPTEGTLFCTFHEISDVDVADERLSSMPIGNAIPGWNLVIVSDDEGERVVVVGDHLAEGYHGVDDPAFGWSSIAGATLRTFDTGDYIERRGIHVCFSHRRDRMVKVSGNRVDLGDVAEAVSKLGVEQPIVVLHDDRLVVFVEDAAELDAMATIASLRGLLPGYAVPSRIVNVAVFPRNANGKVDRGELLSGLVD